LNKLYEDFFCFTESLTAFRPIIGLDLGTKTIGVAASDMLLTAATPLVTIKRLKFKLDLEEILKIINDRNAGGIIIGLPRNMDGSEGPRAQSTRSFYHNLKKEIPLPMAFWDERLSTVAAEKSLLETDTSRKRRAQIIDSVAAAYILQGALNRITNIRSKNDR